MIADILLSDVLFSAWCLVISVYCQIMHKLNIAASNDIFLSIAIDSEYVIVNVIHTIDKSRVTCFKKWNIYLNIYINYFSQQYFCIYLVWLTWKQKLRYVKSGDTYIDWRKYIVRIAGNLWIKFDKTVLSMVA